MKKLETNQEVFFVSFTSAVKPELNFKSEPNAFAIVALTDRYKNEYKMIVIKIFFDDRYNFTEDQPAWYQMFHRKYFYTMEEFLRMKSKKKRAIVKKLFAEAKE